jgi:SAM-dependent methyltransferase
LRVHVSNSNSSEIVSRWIEALASRHLADLRIPEVTRALRALSSAYVERRHKVASGSALDSAGKRAAFALYYGPLHFIATRLVIESLGARTPSKILDLGCGTGTVGAAWALSGDRTATVSGIDRHPWAVDEANRTYRDLGVNGRARTGDIGRLPKPQTGSAVVAGYVLNELPEEVRQRVEAQLVEHAQRGGGVLILEPLARSVAPWWDDTAAQLAAVGGRADEWRFRTEVPELVATLGKAAGLDYRELRLRTMACGILE